MLWDGLGFFGFDDRKIARLEGKPVRWRDKFTSVKATPLMVITLIVAIYIIFDEARLWLHSVQKSQTIQLVPEIKYAYTVGNSIPLMVNNLFYIDQLIPKIQDY